MRRGSARRSSRWSSGSRSSPRCCILAWLTERRVLLWPAFLLSLGLGSGLSLSSHQSDDRGLASVVRRLGAPVGGDALDRRPALAGARRLERPRAAPHRLLALLGDRRPARRARRRGGRLHDLQALPGTPRPLVGRLRPAAARQARARRPRALVGRAPSPRRPPAARPARGRGPAEGFLAGEAVVAVSILLLAAILVDSKPPAKPHPASAAVAVTSRRWSATGCRASRPHRRGGRGRRSPGQSRPRAARGSLRRRRSLPRLPAMPSAFMTTTDHLPGSSFQVRGADPVVDAAQKASAAGRPGTAVPARCT